MAYVFNAAGNGSAPLVVPVGGPPGQRGPAGADSTVPGPEGPQGRSGRDGAQGPAGAGAVTSREASANVPLWSAVVVSDANRCIPADPSNPAHRGQVIGVTAYGGMTGAQVEIQSVGDLLGPVADFAEGTPLFVGAGGILTPTPPTSGWRQIVATAVSSSQIVVALGEARVIADEGTALVVPSGFATAATAEDIEAGEGRDKFVTPQSLAVPLSNKVDRANAREQIGIASGGTLDGVGLGQSEPAAAATTDHLIAKNATPYDGVNYNMSSAAVPAYFVHSPNGFVPGPTSAASQLVLSTFERGWEVQELGICAFGVAKASPRPPGGESGNIFTDGACVLFGGGVVEAGGAGGFWAFACNAEARPGWTGLGCFASEHDMNNFAYYAAPGNPHGNICNVFINGIYGYPATAATWVTGTSAADLWTPNTPASVGMTREANGNIYRCIVAGTTGSNSAPAGTTNSIPDGTAAWSYVSDASLNYCHEFGDFRQGKRLIKAYSYFDDTESRVVLKANGQRTHAEAVISDSSAGPISYYHDGFRTQATFRDAGVSPVSIDILGSHTVADIRMNGGSSTGLLVQGARSSSCIDLTQSTSPNGVALANKMPISFAGSDFRLYADVGAARWAFAQGELERWWITTSSISPAQDNVSDLGFPTTGRIRNIYLANNPSVTSDRSLKTQITDFSDAQLDAWGRVRQRLFRYRAAVAEKGNEARIHAGLIAQEVVAALGDDAFLYGVVGQDAAVRSVVRTRTASAPKMVAMEVEREEIVVEDGRAFTRLVRVEVEEPAFEEFPLFNSDGSPKMSRRFKLDANGDPISRSEIVRGIDGEPATVRKVMKNPETGAEEFQDTIQTKVVMEVEDVQDTYRRPVMVDIEETYTEDEPVLDEAGKPAVLLNIRYEQASIWEAAYQRRRADRLEARLSALEAK